MTRACCASSARAAAGRSARGGARRARRPRRDAAAARRGAQGERRAGAAGRHRRQFGSRHRRSPTGAGPRFSTIDKRSPTPPPRARTARARARRSQPRASGARAPPSHRARSPCSSSWMRSSFLWMTALRLDRFFTFRRPGLLQLEREQRVPVLCFSSSSRSPYLRASACHFSNAPRGRCPRSRSPCTRRAGSSTGTAPRAAARGRRRSASSCSCRRRFLSRPSRRRPLRVVGVAGAGRARVLRVLLLLEDVPHELRLCRLQPLASSVVTFGVLGARRRRRRAARVGRLPAIMMPDGTGAPARRPAAAASRRP